MVTQRRKPTTWRTVLAALLAATLAFGGMPARAEEAVGDVEMEEVATDDEVAEEDLLDNISVEDVATDPAADEAAADETADPAADEAAADDVEPEESISVEYAEPKPADESNAVEIETDAVEPEAIEPVDEKTNEAHAPTSGTALSAQSDGLEAQAARKASVTYRAYRQSYGWQGWRKDGKLSGTTGEAKRLEAIKIKLASKPVSGGIKYRAHVQGIGWQGWRKDGKLSGTTDEGKRLEAIQIKLTGSMAKKYDVWYRVHAQHFGWMGWAKNGQSAGTTGYAYRLEAMQVVLKAKGSKAPSASYKGARRNTKAKFKSAPKKITKSYYSVYAPHLRNLVYRLQRGYDASNRVNVYYFLFDIDGNGVKELMVLERSLGQSRGGAFTIVKNGGKLEVKQLGNIGAGLYYKYYKSGKKLYEQYSGQGHVVQWRVGLSGGEVTTTEVAHYTYADAGMVSSPGTKLREYRLIKNGSSAIDYGPLKKAGKVSR